MGSGWAGGIATGTNLEMGLSFGPKYLLLLLERFHLVRLFIRYKKERLTFRERVTINKSLGLCLASIIRIVG